jgi:type IV pilus biogenesis protein PilP
MPNSPDRRLVALLATPLLLHAHAPRRAVTVASAVAPRRESPRAHQRRPLTLRRLAALEDDIVRLRYELAVAKLRQELAALRPAPLPRPSPADIHPVVRALVARRPRPLSWRVLAIVGRRDALRAVVANRDGRRTITNGARLGSARVVRIAPNGVWIRLGNEQRRLPLAICAERVGCPPPAPGRIL